MKSCHPGTSHLNLSCFRSILRSSLSSQKEFMDMSEMQMLRSLMDGNEQFRGTVKVEQFCFCYLGRLENLKRLKFRKSKDVKNDVYCVTATFLAFQQCLGLPSGFLGVLLCLIFKGSVQGGRGQAAWYRPAKTRKKEGRGLLRQGEKPLGPQTSGHQGKPQEGRSPCFYCALTQQRMSL